MTQRSTQGPQIGTLVAYRCPHHRNEETRPAVVVGYSDEHAEDTTHLAVLTEDADNLDVLSLSVPHDPTARTAGSWHHEGWSDEEGDDGNGMDKNSRA